MYFADSGGANVGEFPFDPYAETEIVFAMDWEQDSLGYWFAFDRGYDSDTYLATLRVSDSDANVNTIQTLLNNFKTELLLKGFNSYDQDIFGPHVNYSSAITAAVLDFGDRQHRYNTSLTTVKIRGYGLSFTGSASLSALKVLPDWKGDSVNYISRNFSISNSPTFTSRKIQRGSATIPFYQTLAEAKAILYSLVIANRAVPFAFPTGKGADYLFGYQHGSGPFNVIVKKIKIKRTDLDQYLLTMDVLEAR